MPRPKINDDSVRLNLRISKEVRDQLESVRVRSNSDSMTEVVRHALTLYDALLAEQEEGAQVVLRWPNEKEQLVKLIF